VRDRQMALGVDPHPASPTVSAVESVSELNALGVAGSGAGERIVDLTLLESPRRGLLNASAAQRFTKRAVDVVGSSILLIVTLPLAVLSAMAILLTSRGPLLYVQERVGKEGRPFRMLKFRSMRRDAHEVRGDVLHLNTATGPVFKVPRDPRITTVGRLIRKLSIDEIPQLVNVLRGDMSLVGPRPPLPDEYSTYGERERGRLAVSPGITCIWQVSGRSDLDFDTWVSMDLEYVENWTLLTDIRLLLQTIPAVLSGRGAY
jgi:lipopolysaccharide/colanic/teichoic acid biosynthesis glycosyltransferase